MIPFKSMDRILWRYHKSETSKAVLLQDTITIRFVFSVFYDFS